MTKAKRSKRQLPQLSLNGGNFTLISSSDTKLSYAMSCISFPPAPGKTPWRSLIGNELL